MRSLKKVMVVSAHFDDLVLGLGATVAKYSSEGALIHNLILGEPKMTSRGVDKDLTEVTEKANDILGADTFFYNLPDQKFDAADRLKLNKDVETHIRRFKPHIVYTHWKNDLNRDHQITYEATMVACRPRRPRSLYPKDPRIIYPREMLSFHVPGASDWSFVGFNPNVFVNISDFMDRKIEALECFEGEIIEERSVDSIKAFNRHWGAVVGVNYAEPFVLVRGIR